MRTLRAWTGSHLGREIKAPKVFPTDPGLMMATLGFDAHAASPVSPRDAAGPLDPAANPSPVQHNVYTGHFLRDLDVTSAPGT